jgi:hypothetical protein
MLKKQRTGFYLEVALPAIANIAPCNSSNIIKHGGGAQ